MSDQIASIHLPAGDLQPGYFEALGKRSHFHAESIGGDRALVCPAEGAGQVFNYFEKFMLCDSSTDLSNPDIWAPIADRPPRLRSDVDPASYLDEMIEKANEILSRSEDLQSQISAFSLVALGASQANELEKLLSESLQGLFAVFPDGALWYVTTHDLLPARLMLASHQLSLQLMPDLPLGPDVRSHNAFSDMTMTQGMDFSPVMQFPLLVLSPSVLGFVIPATPHMLVFTFGTDVDLRQPIPFSLSSIFRPRALGTPTGPDRTEFLATTEPGDGGDLLDWWIDRANVLYSYLADPTRFTDAHGSFDAAKQTAEMVTIERLMGDATSLLAEPQATDLDRIQMAFDLFDKAEALLGYRYRDRGRGFRALLKKQQTVRRVRESFAEMPGNLGVRIGDDVERLFESTYDSVLSKTAPSRFTTTGQGINIVRQPPDSGTVSFDLETYVAKFLRAIRNSSHGLIGTMDGGQDGYVLAINSGGVPPSLPALAPLIALGLFADVERLIDGSWKYRLTRRANPVVEPTPETGDRPCS